MKAAGFAFAGGVLTFFGLMHGEAIGINQTPLVALSYLTVSGVLFGCAKLCVAVKKPATEPAQATAGELEGAV